MTTDDSTDTPAQGEASGRIDAFAVTVDKKMRVRKGNFDGERSRRELFAWATTDGETDFRKAAKGFVIADLAGEPTHADLQLPVAYVEDGRLVAIRDGLRDAIVRLPQTKGLTEQVAAKAQATLEGMLERLSEMSDASTEMSAPLTADVLTEQMAVDDGRVFRTCRMSLHLDARQTQAINLAISVAEANGGLTDESTMRAVGDAFRRDGFEDQLTDEGFWRGPVLAARTGTQTYSDGLTTWGEFRSDEEVGESLATYGLKAFADNHPPVLVTSANYRDFAVGSIGQDAILTEPQADGQRYVKVTILVGDLGTLRKIRDGKVELSAGYTVIPVRDDGVDPVTGESFKFRQTKIRINHLALVDAGRAGPLARIELDGSAWELPQAHGDTMSEIKKDQLDPETSEMLRASLASYMQPESPEAGEAALESAANIMGIDPDALRAALSPATPEPAMEAASPPEFLAVDIADGVTINMAPESVPVWTAHLAERSKVSTDAEAAKTSMAKTIEDQGSKIAELTADQAVTRRTTDRLQDHADAIERSALLAQVKPVCADLVEQWGKHKTDAALVASLKVLSWDDGKITERPITAMRRAAIVNIDESYAMEFEGARAEFSGDAWDKYIARAFAREVNQADGRMAKRAADTTTNQVVSNDDVLRHAAFGGARR